jgi:hypothetical protein
MNTVSWLRKVSLVNARDHIINNTRNNVINTVLINIFIYFVIFVHVIVQVQDVM